MMNKSLRGRGRESSRKTLYGFQPGRRRRQKKSRRFRRLLKLDNREASNRVDRSHSVSKEDDPTHKRESLIDRKRGIFFSLRLPYRPLAEWGTRAPDAAQRAALAA
jgi:hypothetical protein